ncbi:hypothetical protein EW146_g7738 [Bondarzewia mesenterica]|uniref:Uncharacterized protein n=1 Tax=Bondarzewia mesenterica TaxID=1095465 RepID=A0A4S4LLK0_9AGAM|nr:hypothetical protein EW146_g7738 [Bondarzewia mesenterica]
MISHEILSTGETISCSVSDCDFVTLDPALLSNHRKDVHGHIPHHTLKYLTHKVEDIKVEEEEAGFTIPAISGGAQARHGETGQHDVPDQSSIPLHVTFRTDAPTAMVPSGPDFSNPCVLSGRDTPLSTLASTLDPVIPVVHSQSITSPSHCGKYLTNGERDGSTSSPSPAALLSGAGAGASVTDTWHTPALPPQVTLMGFETESQRSGLTSGLRSYLNNPPANILSAGAGTAASLPFIPKSHVFFAPPAIGNTHSVSWPCIESQYPFNPNPPSADCTNTFAGHQSQASSGLPSSAPVFTQRFDISSNAGLSRGSFNRLDSASGASPYTTYDNNHLDTPDFTIPSTTNDLLSAQQAAYRDVEPQVFGFIQGIDDANAAPSWTSASTVFSSNNGIGSGPS